jgi:hypothetical protein
MDKSCRPHERRRYFRLRYPVSARPLLTISMRSFLVRELSEGGLRFAADMPDEFRVNDIVQGKITFRDRESLPVEGRVLRLVEDEIIVELTKGIPLKRMVEEQKYLIKHFPGLRAR